MKSFVIIGTGDFADIVYSVIKKRMKRDVKCFVVNDEYYKEAFYKSVPVIKLSDIETACPKEECTIALGFIGKKMFDDREKMMKNLTQMGYSFENVSEIELDEADEIGQGNIILKNVSIGYGVKIGDANIIWPGCVFPHHNKIGCFNNIAPTASLSGYSEVGNHCYIGNNSTIKNRLKIADYTLVGAGAYVTKDTSQYQVIVPTRSYVLENKLSTDFY